MNAVSSLPAEMLRRGVNEVIDRLCETVDGNFDVYVEVPTPDEDAQRLGILVNSLLQTVRDQVSALEDARRSLERTVEQRTQRLSMILEGTSDGVWVWDLDADTIEMSHQWYTMLGLPVVDGPVKPTVWTDRIHPSDRTRFHILVKSHLDGLTTTLDFEYRLRHRSGAWRWFNCRAVGRYDDAGKAIFLAGAQTDITERRNIDRRSGLPNELSFRERLDELVSERASFGLLLCSIDRAMDIRESLDDIGADQFIGSVARRFVSTVPTRATVGWLGGYVFGVIADTKTDLVEIASELLEAFRSPLEINRNRFNLTISIGLVADFSKMGETEQPLSGGWTALRSARSAGGDRMVTYCDALRSHAERKFEIERAIRSALVDDRLVPHFQPIRSIDGSRVCGFEALARIEKLDGGLLSPAIFIPVSEEVGLVRVIGERILPKALAAFSQMRKRGDVGPEAFVSVNLAPDQINEGLVDFILTALDLAKLPPESLKLEITETALVSQLDLAISVLGRLRSHGVSIAIDDFGTGYSSLTYLRQLPVDTIKIDRSFVTKIHRKPEQISILKTICGLAKLLALNTVAEGVETESERAALEKLGVDYGQGWLFGKPAPIDLKPNHNRAIGPTERTSGDQR